MKNNFLKVLKIIGIVIALAAVTALVVWLFPYVMKLRDETFRLEFEEKISSLGVLGVVAMLLLQTAQIVVAIIPGEPIEIVMGVMYGTFGGLVLCLAGIALGTFIVFCGVNRFGMKFVKRFIDSDGFKKLKFLNDPVKRDFFLFILFFIPGTPKDLLTYFAPFTKVKFRRFLLISLIARIPSVVSSTYIGSSITDGNLIVSVIVFAAMGVIGLAGIYIYNRILGKHNNESNENNDSDGSAS